MRKRSSSTIEPVISRLHFLLSTWRYLLSISSPSFRMSFLLVFCLLIFWLISIRIAPVSAAPTSYQFWGVDQESDFDIVQPINSLDGPEKAFDDLTASSTFLAVDKDVAWTVTSFGIVTPLVNNNIEMEISFWVSGWQITDTLQLQVSANGGRDWISVEDFTAKNPPPDRLLHKKYNFSSYFPDLIVVQAPQTRLFSPYLASSDRGFSIDLDEVSLTLPGFYSATNTSTPTQTPTIIAIATQPITQTPTPVLTTTISILSTLPVITETPLVAGTTSTPTLDLTTTVLTPTIQPSITPTPTLTSTPVPTLSLNLNNMSKSESLGGIQQVCDFTIDNPQNSVDELFNDQSAACSGDFAAKLASWKFYTLRHTTFTHVDDAILKVRLSMSGWVDDQINMEISDGSQWFTLDQFAADKSIPPSALTTLYYPVAKILNTSEKVNQTAVRLIGVIENNAPDTVTIQVDSVQVLLAGGVEAIQAASLQSTPADLPFAQILAPVAGEPHSDFSITTDSCSACHNGHAAVGRSLRESWPEEAVCFTCHGSSGPGTNIQPAFTNYMNTATSFFSHDIMNTNGIHGSHETGGSSFGGANRHVECEDCHDPHYSNHNIASAPMIPGEMNSVGGVDPIWSGAGAPVSYTWLDTATREFQVCFKCHSSYTILPSYVPDGWNGTSIVANGLRKLTSSITAQVNDSRDLAKEFNPNQVSYHPVTAQGKNQNIAAASFVNGWSQSSLVYCTDCHQNPQGGTQGLGTHGSPLLHLLTGQSNYSTVKVSGAPVVPSSQVCFQCHNYTTYVTNSNSATHFRLHSYHMNKSWGTTCYTCHDSHGSEQQHLINFDSSVVTPMGGRNSQTAWYYDPVTGRAGCWLTCHNQGHDPKEYTP